MSLIELGNLIQEADVLHRTVADIETHVPPLIEELRGRAPGARLDDLAQTFAAQVQRAHEAHAAVTGVGVEEHIERFKRESDDPQTSEQTRQELQQRAWKLRSAATARELGIMDRLEEHRDVLRAASAKAGEIAEELRRLNDEDADVADEV